MNLVFTIKRFDMLELKGNKYSRESFEDYKFRASFEFTVKEQYFPSKIDIYTTDTDRNSVYEVVYARKTDKVIDIKLVDWASKEYDEHTSKFLEETLKDI